MIRQPRSRAIRLSRMVALVMGATAIGGVAVPALVAGKPTAGARGSGSAALSLATLPVPRATPSAPERHAIQLLMRAATAGRDRTYSGTQYIFSWSTAGASSLVVDLQHVPGRGVLVRRAGALGSTVLDATGAGALDPRALAVLERHYSVSVARQHGQCAGRRTQIVEARRRGESALAGSFWLDTQTGLLLRRELYDRTGRTVRAAAFVDLQLAVPRPWDAPRQGPWDALRQDASAHAGSPMQDDHIAALRRAGWAAPAALAGGLELFDVRQRDGVLHLSYTDGLFAVSVFSQRGRLDSRSVKGWQQVEVDGIRAWTRPGLSQRVVWAGDGWVHTVVADAPDSLVSAAVTAFPASAGESFADRVQRGLHRMRSWADPTR